MIYYRSIPKKNKYDTCRIIRRRITKNKGLICFTINEGIYEEYGFDKKIIELKNNKEWKEIEFFKSNYIASKNVNAWLGLFEVKK